jgi:hypothetical protein
MKKNTFYYLLIFGILFTLSSCATDPLMRKNIIGVWVPEKFGTMDMRKLIPDGDSAGPQYSESDYKMLNDMKESLSKTGSEGKVEKGSEDDFSRMIMEASTTYAFREEGIGGRMSPVNPVKGKWKMKKKGTRLVLTDDLTKDQFVLIIDSLTSKRMVATNKYLPNGMKISYKKESDEY